MQTETYHFSIGVLVGSNVGQETIGIFSVEIQRQAVLGSHIVDVLRVPHHQCDRVIEGDTHPDTAGLTTSHTDLVLQGLDVVGQIQSNLVHGRGTGTERIHHPLYIWHQVQDLINCNSTTESHTQQTEYLHPENNVLTKHTI